jgi:hypothetical protein
MDPRNRMELGRLDVRQELIDFLVRQEPGLDHRVHAPKRQYILCQSLDFDKGAAKDSS